jgi:threonine aldolase
MIFSIREPAKENTSMERRDFLKIGGLSATSGIFVHSSLVRSEGAKNGGFARHVDFTGDGLSLSPLEYATELRRIAGENGFEADYYTLGGSIEALERKFAALLGKERAVFVPTGTLANHLAIRHLAGNDRRAIVQAESHFYNDSGDCAGTLSGLTLIPLAPGRATFTLEEVKASVERAGASRVPAGIGVISIESPVRRRLQEMFDFDEMAKICAFARERGLRLHLDGARLFNLPFHSGRAITAYTSLFDTVYISLWKCFNAASGAILAGSAAIIDGQFQTRRMFGGSLPQAWPVAAVAAGYAEGYLGEYAKAWKNASVLLSALAGSDRFAVEKIASGTSVFKLRVRGTAPETFAGRLKEKGVILSPTHGPDGVFNLIVNTSLNSADPRALIDAFVGAAGV